MNKTLIENTLIELGMPASMKGFCYIVDIVSLLDNPEWKNPKWTALYYCIGKMHDCNGSSVERAIRNSLQVTRDRCCNYNSIDNYIGFANCENSHSLMQLYIKLKQKDQCQDIHVTKLMLKQALLDIINT